MYDNALIFALKKLSRKEMTRFRDFSLSPYFNKHAGVRDLTAYLSDVFPDFNEKNCDRARIWQKIKPKEKYDYPHLALLFTYTLRLAEDFFATEKLREKDAERLLLSAEYLRERRLEKRYEKTENALSKTVEKAAFRDADFYYRKYRLAEERDQKYLKITQRRTDDGLQEKQDALDLWFMAMKLRDACEMRMRRRYFGQEYEAGLLSEILVKVKAKPTDYQSVPAVYLYFLIYEMLVKNEPAEYFLLKAETERVADFFPKAELQNIYNYLQNFCIGQINRGQTDFLHELFLVYQSQIEKELIFEKDGTLAEWHYKNIVTAGLRSRAFAWVLDFIEKYKTRLKSSVAENAYSFNLANYFFATEKYREVLPLLIQVEYSDMRYKLDVRALLLRTYYHLAETEAFYALCDAFNQLLLRTKDLTDFQRTGYRNMIRMSRRIFAWREEKEYMKRADWQREGEKLRGELASLQPIFNGGWLREILGE